MQYSVVFETHKFDEEKKLKAIVQFDETRKDIQKLVSDLYSYSQFVKELKEDAQMHGMDASKAIEHTVEQVQLKLQVLVASAYLD